MRRRPTAADLLFPRHMLELDLILIKEVRVCEERRWKIDFAEKVTPKGRPRLAFEIEGLGPRSRGGIGGHQDPKGFQDNIHKYAEAQVQGFTLFRFTTQDVLDGTAKDFVRRWLDRNQ